MNSKVTSLDKVSLNENTIQLLSSPPKISRLDCVKIAISSQLSKIEKANPNAKVGFVTFGDSVNVYGDKIQCKENDGITGAILNNYEALIEKGSAFFQTHFNNPISKTISILLNNLKAFNTSGVTALGPALTISSSIASKGKPGSKVIICTDGIANRGIGKIGPHNQNSNNEARIFYNNIGNYAKHMGLVISLITIADTRCRLDLLSPTANLTNGDIVKVNPLLLDKNFGEILSEKLIATNSSVEVHLPLPFSFTQEDETLLKNDNSVLIKEIGNATKDTIITFEYEIKPDFELQKLNIDKSIIKSITFQALIYFTTMNNKKCIRAITKKRNFS